MPDYEHLERSRSGAATPGQMTTADGFAPSPGQRTLTEQLAPMAPPASDAESGSLFDGPLEWENLASPRDESARADNANNAPADRPWLELLGVPGSDNIDRPAGGLWAQDQQGKNLPPSLDDVAQGQVGDCHLFAAMAAIVDSDPNLIVSMIVDHGDGTYTVTLKGAGKKHKVTAEFPKGRHGKVAARNALWPLILEKAYAAEVGGIDKLDLGGDPGRAVDDLVNKDASRFDPRKKSAAQVLSKLHAAEIARKPITLHSGKKEDGTREAKVLADRVGLYFKHAYTVIDVDVKGERVQLFNPWGYMHPNQDGWLDVKDVIVFFVAVSING